MLKAKKLGLILLMAFVMLAALPAAYAAEVSDIEGHWASKTIESWLEKGWIQGFPDGSFRPDNTTTRAEITVLINKAFGFTETSEPGFSDVNEQNWFYEPVSIAVKAGYISGYPDGTFKPNNPMSRQELSVILNQLLDLPAGDESKLPADAKNAPEWSRGAVAAVYGAELIAGYQDGTFRPKNDTTRAEVVAMLQRGLSFKGGPTPPGKPVETTDPLKEGMINEAGVYGGTNSNKRVVDGNLEIAAGKVTLQNVIVKGDLLITAGSGEVTLNNVTVEGNVTIEGGAHTIVRGSTQIDTVEINDGAKLESKGFRGSMKQVVLTEDISEDATVELAIDELESVSIHASNMKVVISKGSIDQLTVEEDAENVTIELRKGVNIGELIVHSPVKITGEGIIDKAVIHVKGSEIDVEVKQTDDKSGGSGGSPGGGSPGGGFPGGGGVPVPPGDDDDDDQGGPNPGTIISVSVKVGDKVISATKKSKTFTFVIPADIDENAMITEFEIRTSNNIRFFTMDDHKIEVKNGIAKASVSEMLGELDPQGDGVAVKTLVNYLIANDSEVLKKEGKITDLLGRDNAFEFILDAKEYINKLKLPTLKSVSVTVGGKVYSAEQTAASAFKFTIPSDVDQLALITDFEIKASDNAKRLKVNGHSIDFENGVAKATVSEMLGELDPAGDGVTVKTLVEYLIANESELFEIEGKLVDEDGKEKTFTFILDASEFTSELPSLTSMSVTVGGKVYNADQTAPLAFKFTIPSNVDQLALITDFEIKASDDAKRLKVNGHSIDFENGVAKATVSEMLGELDPAGDGVTVKTLVEYLIANESEVLEVKGKLVNAQGKEKTFTFILDASEFTSELPSLTSMSVTVGGTVFTAEQLAPLSFKFTIPADVDQLAMITDFEIKASDDAKQLKVNGHSIEFENGVAKATVSEMLGELDPAGDGVAVKTVVEYLIANESEVMEVKGKLVNAQGKEKTFTFILDASKHVKQLPMLKTVSATVGGSTYSAVQTEPLTFVFTLPADIDELEMITDVHIEASKDAETIKVGEHVASFTSGVLSDSVSSLLQDLDPQGDGVSVKTLKALADQFGKATVTVTSKDGLKQTYTFKLSIE